MASGAELIDRVDLRRLSFFLNVMDQYRDHFLHARRVMRFIHRSYLHLGTLRHVFFESNHQIFGFFQGKLIEWNVRKAVDQL